MSAAGDIPTTRAALLRRCDAARIPIQIQLATKCNEQIPRACVCVREREREPQTQDKDMWREDMFLCNSAKSKSVGQHWPLDRNMKQLSAGVNHRTGIRAWRRAEQVMRR